MGTQTKIEWTQMTWNPITGCSKISEGCRNCYAERIARRLQKSGHPRYANGFRVTIHHDAIDQPKRISTPRMIFVNSMSDLFHEHIPEETIEQIFHTMASCPQHTFQILTKRSTRLRAMAPRLPWPSNIWMGVSVENAKVTNRIDHLRDVPVAIRWLSCEPLLGPLDQLNLQGISWVVVGGESGPGARPMNPKWVHSILRQCRAAKIPFFFKQWGGPYKHLTGRTLNGRIYDEYPVTPPPP